MVVQMYDTYPCYSVQNYQLVLCRCILTLLLFLWSKWEEIRKGRLIQLAIFLYPESWTYTLIVCLYRWCRNSWDVLY